MQILGQALLVVVGTLSGYVNGFQRSAAFKGSLINLLDGLRQSNGG